MGSLSPIDGQLRVCGPSLDTLDAGESMRDRSETLSGLRFLLVFGVAPGIMMKIKQRSRRQRRVQAVVRDDANRRLDRGRTA